MIRDMRRNGAQPKDAMHKAKVAMKTGMGVVIENAETVKFPASETATNVYVATKERIPKGLNVMLQNMSDYDPDFVDIEANERICLERYTDGEKFATDQYKTSDFEASITKFTKEFAVSVGTDGKWQKATASSMPSKYIFEGVHNDNGHILIVIRVEADPIKNA